MAFQPFTTGTADGDHTGDTVRGVFVKIKSMLQELYALTGGSGTGYLATAVTAASTNNYDPGSSFPTNYSWLDIDPSTNDIILTGLIAGTDGQPLTIRNIGSTYNITLTTASGSSTAANQFSGQGDAAAWPGGIIRLTYRLLPSPRWAIG